MAPTSPTVARWELALRIKARRDELGLSVRTITEHLGFSRNYWSAVENERAVLANDRFNTLMELMKFDDETVGELRVLLDEGRRRGWWTEYSQLDEETQRFCGLEHGASTIRTFEPIMIPGLLQTPEYARSFLESDPMFSPVSIVPLLETRRRRQSHLDGENPPSITALLSEGALRQHVGDGAIQRQQLDYLLKAIDSRPNSIEVRVIPFSRAIGALGSSSTLVIMGFSSEHLPVVAWQEAIRPLGVIHESSQVRRIEYSFDEAVGRSLSREESRSFVADVMNSIAT